MTAIKRVVDLIVFRVEKLVLIERLSFPPGLAFPGGHIEVGERPIETAKRELTEETGLHALSIRYIGRAAGKKRDPRGPSVSRIYRIVATGKIRNEKGKTRVYLFTPEEALLLPIERFAFDHGKLLHRYVCAKQ